MAVMNRPASGVSIKRIRPYLAVATLTLTAVVFVRFFATHPQYRDQIRHVSLAAILAILGLNVGVVLCVTLVNDCLTRLCGTRLPLKEQFLLTAYSSIANFFGPLQSGPGVRAAYLKTKHGIRLRDYALANLVYYAILASLSALLLVGGNRPWWQAGLALLVVAAVSYAIIGFLIKRPGSAEPQRFRFDGPLLLRLLIVTSLQLCFVAAYYFIEIRAVAPSVSLHQALAYCGAANFALFVSLTPDAIGIRESFLVLSKRLHHIGNAVIISANLIDRAVYALFLGLLFILVLVLHAKDRLGIRHGAA